MKVFLLLLVVSSQLALASGWKCQDEEGNWDVRLYNHVDPYLGTTNPSQFIVSENGQTIVHRFSPDIDFLSTSKGTTYRTTNTKNDYGCIVNFHIGFREGVDSIPAGQHRVGRLFFTNCLESEDTSYALTCKRYLKNP